MIPAILIAPLIFLIQGYYLMAFIWTLVLIGFGLAGYLFGEG
jgi:hypothetical protein